MTDSFPAEKAVSLVVVPRTRDLGDGFEVRRALPTTQRRMVGPFVFLDQMGPHVLAPGKGLDVRPHPHTCLATVTYLFDGEIMHRDSLGTVQAIRPGEVNWMTAGRGIVHSERTPAELRGAGSSLFGLQCWVALPRAHEEHEPMFAHVGSHELPIERAEGVTARVIAGACFGQASPVKTLSDMIYVDIHLQPGAALSLPADFDEQAIYIAEGRLDLGVDGIFDAGQLLVLNPKTIVTARALPDSAVRFVLLGGEPMDGPRYLSWNFVASSEERILQAREDWRNGRFPAVPGEHEFIPLPEEQGRPVHYP